MSCVNCCPLWFLMISIFILDPSLSSAQEIWNFPDPIINQGSYTISDTIYMSPDGDDANTGGPNDPVASFAKALQLLPYGERGINDGHAYGLVILKAGVYHVESGLQQSAAQYEQDGTYKNISIEGQGEVFIQGRPNSYESLANGHMIHLRGSHIYIRNLNLKFAKLHGILLASSETMTDILIEDVTVDSMGEFSMLTSNVENIVVRNSRFLRGSRIFNDSLVTGPNCKWPSGLKFYGSKFIKAYNNEVAYTRGEGLNFHNSEYGLAYNNRLHDNPTNIYCDNSARIILRSNFVFNTPGNTKYWKTCPGNPGESFGGNGVLIANEGACDIGGPIYQNCKTVCPLLGKEYRQIDSVFIYNNLFVNTTSALNLWQGITQPIGGPNCVQNVFFEHNTVVGMTGGPLDRHAPSINAYFPNAYKTITGFGYAVARNIHIRSNIISVPFEEFSRTDISSVVLHQTFPVPFDFNFENNLVNQDDEWLDNSDEIVNSIIQKVDLNSDSLLFYLLPCPSNEDLQKKVEAPGYITSDFRALPRLQESTNVGALEYDQQCSLINSTYKEVDKGLKAQWTIFPNPGNHTINIKSSYPASGEMTVQFYNSFGQLINFDKIKLIAGCGQVSVRDLAPGFYTLKLYHANHVVKKKYLVQR